MVANSPRNAFDIDAWFALDRYAHVDEAAFLKLTEEAFADWNSKEDEEAFLDL